MLSGKTALVTGGSKGIGAAIADELARTGAHVVVTYLNSERSASLLVRAITRAGFKAEMQRCDVSDAGQCKNLFERIEASGRGVDILINNAGITRDRSLRNMSEDEWTGVFDVNLHGTKRCSKLALETMIGGAYGRIVNVASVVGQIGAFGQTNYAASKGALLAFTKALSLEVARYGVTVNAVCPGYIETDMWAAIPQTVQAKILSDIPLGRVGTVNEVASCVRYLVTEGTYVTGQIFNVNGGIYRGG